MGIGGQDCQLGTIPKFLQTVLSGSSQVESENHSCYQGRYTHPSKNDQFTF